MHKSLQTSVADFIANKAQISEMGLSSIFVTFDDSIEINFDEIREFCNLHKIKLNCVVSVFSGDKTLEKMSDAKAVYYLDEASEYDPSDVKTQFNGVCVTHKGVRELKLQEVAKIASYNIEGIWFDDLHYFTLWAQETPLILDTCYCDRCLELFSQKINEPITGANLEEKYLLIDGCYYHEWLEFKAQQIIDFVQETKKIIHDSNKKIKTGAFVVPWDDTQYSSAIKRVLGQDFQKLSENVDFLSPKLFHRSCKKDAIWIKDRVEHFWSVGAPFLPFVEASESATNEYTPLEFEDVLKKASGAPSLGVGVFGTSKLVNNEEFLEVLKKFD